MEKYRLIKYACVDTDEYCLPSEFEIGKFKDKNSAIEAKRECVDSQIQFLDNLNMDYSVSSDTDTLWAADTTDTRIEIFIEEIKQP